MWRQVVVVVVAARACETGWNLPGMPWHGTWAAADTDISQNTAGNSASRDLQMPESCSFCNDKSDVWGTRGTIAQVLLEIDDAS